MEQITKLVRYRNKFFDLFSYERGFFELGGHFVCTNCRLETDFNEEFHKEVYVHHITVNPVLFEIKLWSKDRDRVLLVAPYKVVLLDETN